jgi:hypothetical protein
MATTTHPLKGLRGKHALFEIMTVSAAAVGAAIGGVLAWPMGLVVGGIIGLASGLIIGKGLEVGGTQAAARERRMDDQIGVTSGELGAQEIASSRLSRPGGKADGASDNETPGVLLHRDHLKSESLLAELVLSIDRGTWQDARVRWAALEHRLRTHFATEESVLFPELRRVKSGDVDALLEDHANLRRLIIQFGAGVQERQLRGDIARALGDALRDHRAREDRLAYPAADARLSASDVIDIEMSLDT